MTLSDCVFPITDTRVDKPADTDIPVFQQCWASYTRSNKKKVAYYIGAVFFNFIPSQCYLRVLSHPKIQTKVGCKVHVFATLYAFDPFGFAFTLQLFQ